jgi:hypothetical protein
MLVEVERLHSSLHETANDIHLHCREIFELLNLISFFSFIIQHMIRAHATASFTFGFEAALVDRIIPSGCRVRSCQCKTSLLFSLETKLS